MFSLGAFLIRFWRLSFEYVFEIRKDPMLSFLRPQSSELPFHCFISLSAVDRDSGQ